MIRSLVLGLIAVALALAGCSSTRRVYTGLWLSPSQQFITSKAALDRGSITQADFDRQMARVLANQ